MRNAEFWSWFDGVAEPLEYRASTFRKMFEYLESLDRPVTIVETGCLRVDGNWQDGQSTILFDKFAQTHEGTLVCSVDINLESVELADRLTSSATLVFLGDSLQWLRSEIVPDIDLLYLDSMDYDASNPYASAAHHLQELFIALPRLHEMSLVVVDDTPEQDGILIGKGCLIAKYAESIGAYGRFSKYQTGWTRMVGPEQSLEELVDTARFAVEGKNDFAAIGLYRLIYDKSRGLHSGQARVACGEACVHFARRVLKSSKFGTAADYYREALVADPLAVDYRLELCTHALLPMGALKEAKNEAEKATRIEPDYAPCWHTLGGILHELGDIEGCIVAYDRQLQISPDNPGAKLDRATIALDTGDYDSAVTLAIQCLATERHGDALHCLAMVAYREEEFDRAIAFYKDAIAHSCSNIAQARWNMSLCMHALGQYKEGWQEHEARVKIISNPGLSLPPRRFRLPLWKGETSGRVHVHSEAGMGDNLCLVRYLDLFGGDCDVRFEAYEGMVTLLQRSFPKVRICTKAADWPGALGLEPFDYHLPIGSCPAAFGTTIDTIPWSGPYLIPNPDLVDYYSQRIPKGSIGLCWSSGIREGIWIQQYGKNKSMALADMALIMSQKQNLVSLQVGPERKELEDFPNIRDVLPIKPSWDDTAAVIANLDAVVTVDTAIAHLAGGMGKPVYLAMHRQGSWHFMADIEPFRTKSPWYPNTKIFRRGAKDTNWHNVVLQIAKALS